jgi:hypothetical protein
MGRLLNRDRQFFRWEMQFMLYGLAFFIIFTLLAPASLLMWRQGLLLGNGAEFRNGVNR